MAAWRQNLLSVDTYLWLLEGKTCCLWIPTYGCLKAKLAICEYLSMATWRQNLPSVDTYLRLLEGKTCCLGICILLEGKTCCLGMCILLEGKSCHSLNLCIPTYGCCGYQSMTAWRYIKTCHLNTPIYDCLKVHQNVLSQYIYHVKTCYLNTPIYDCLKVHQNMLSQYTYLWLVEGTSKHAISIHLSKTAWRYFKTCYLNTPI